MVDVYTKHEASMFTQYKVSYISETVQDIVTMEDKYKIIYELSNGMIANDLEWFWRSLLLSETFVMLVTDKAWFNYDMFTHKLESARDL